MKTIIVIALAFTGIAALVTGIPAERKLIGSWEVLSAGWTDTRFNTCATEDEKRIVAQVMKKYQERSYRITPDGKFWLETRSGKRSGEWELREGRLEFRFGNNEQECWSFEGDQPRLMADGTLKAWIGMGNSTLHLVLKKTGI